MGLLGWLAKLVDPRGPIGEVASPSDVWKSRAGLPVSSPHSIRVELETTAEVERALAPTRFVASTEANPPPNRVRVLSAFVEEVWQPRYQVTTSTDPFEIVRASETLIGWKVTQRVRNAYCDCTKARFSRTADGAYVHKDCGRARKHLTHEQFVEVIQHQQVQASDEFYNGYYETIPGTDPLMIDGEIVKGTPVYDKDGKCLHDGTITGGTLIRGGRADYNAKTKGMVHWDLGVVREREKALAAEAAAPIAFVHEALERTRAEVLPMRRIVGPNPRYDRQSPV